MKSDTSTHHFMASGPHASRAQADAAVGLEETGRADPWLKVFVGTSATPTTVAYNAIRADVFERATTVPISTFGSTVVSTVSLPWRIGRRLLQLMWRRRRRPAVVLEPAFRGGARPGDMVLVASAVPGECTQFLSAIARHVSASTPGFAVFCSAEDVHPHVLTVEQLLRFRLRARAVRSRHDEDEAVELLLEAFHLSHIRHTLIGNTFVRGISGGERRRLSVAEALLSGADVLCFDDLTRGLDSTTALQCVRCLCYVASTYQLTVFVSLSAGSDAVYTAFDQIVVIRDGRPVVCGPPLAALAAMSRDAGDAMLASEGSCFEQLHACIGAHAEGRMADVFLGTGQHSEGEGKGESKSKSRTADSLNHMQAAFVVRQRVRVRLRLRPRLRVQAGRVMALLQRQVLLAWKDRFAVAVSWSLFLVLGWTIGIACFQLPATAAGAEARAGLLYTCVLSVAVSAQVEVAKSSLGRPLLRKVVGYRFESAAAFWTARPPSGRRRWRST